MKTGSAIDSGRITRELQARFNPIRSLTPETLSRQLESFKVGYIRELALLWDAMENRDINLKNVASKRKKAVSRLPWEIVTVEGAPEKEAQQQREALKYFYDNITVTSALEQDERGGVGLLVRQMMDSIGKRYAVHEIVWQPANAAGAAAPKIARGEMIGEDGKAQPLYLDTFLTAEFRFCPLWFFESRTGKLRFLPVEHAIDGQEMRDSEWMVTVGDGIMEACAVAYMFKHMALKDWIAFSEKFGLPGVLGKTDAAKDSADWQAMEEAVESLINDWAAVTNRTSEIQLLETKGGAGNLPFPPLVEYMDRKIAAIWRGADLSTISSGTGGDSTGASLQGDESEMLLQDDAQLASETLNKRVDCHVIRYLFNTNHCYAYIKIVPPKRQNIEQEIKVDEFLVKHGAPVSVQNALERYGRPNPDDADELLAAPASGAANAVPAPGEDDDAKRDKALANEQRFEQTAKQTLARALAEDLKPVRDRLASIMEIEDAAILRQKLTAFIAELPQLLKDIGADPESAKAFQAIIGASMINGMEEAKV